MKWLDKHQEKILFFTWAFIILVCIFIIFTSPVKAAESQKKLPYDYSWNYYAIPETTLNIALSHASNYFDTSEDNVIVFWYEIGNGSWLYQFCVAQVDDVTYTSGYNYDTADLTVNNITLHFSHSAIGFTDGNSLVDPGNQNYSPSSYTFFGSNAVLVQPTGPITQTYTHMPLYGTVVLDDQLIIGTPEDNPVIDTGHATEPINDPDNFINGIDGHPIAKPDPPTITPFTPPVPQFPSIDTSTIETLLESLIDVTLYGIEYLTGILTGFFSNFLSNLTNLFNFLIDSLNYAINKIIKSIQDLATDFYNNMVSLFEPMFQALEYISQPISGTVIYDNLSNTGIISNYNSIVTDLNAFKDSFDNLSEPATYSIPIHLENLPSSYFGNLSTQYIDLSVINPVKSIIRTFIWALVTYGLIITIFDSIANYINGGGDE